MKTSMRLTALILAALWGCGDGGSDHAPSDGPERWSLEGPTLSIGELDGETPYLFQTIAAVVLLPDGGVAIADRGHSVVRRFDAEGRFESEFGGAGRGPGEFDYLTAMELRGSDTLAVYDSGLFRLTKFGLDGAVLGTTTFSVSNGMPEIYLGTYSSGGTAFGWIDQAMVGALEREIQPDPMRFGRFGVDGRLETRLGEGTGLRRGPNGVQPFTPQLHGFLFRDTIYHTDGIRPRIEVLSPTGEPGPPVALPLSAISFDEAVAALRPVLEAGDDPEVLRMLDEASSDSIPALSEVVMDDEGRFWVKHYDPATDAHLAGAWAGVQGGHWSVVTREGQVVATVEMPSGFRPLVVGGEIVLGVARDELGVQRVQAYAVVR